MAFKYKRIDALWLLRIIVVTMLVCSINPSRFQMFPVPGVNAFDPVAINLPPCSNGNSNNRKVCFVDDDDAFLDKSQERAKSMNLPTVSQLQNIDMDEYTHALRLVPYESNLISTYALSIEALPASYDDSTSSKRRKPKRKRSTTTTNPFYVDFCPSKQSRMGKRGAQQSGSDLLLKAAGLKKKQEKSVVFDLTAGFGQDSVLLALSGGARRVVMVERDPIVASLLEDALRRVDILAAVESEEDDEVEIAKSLSKCLSVVVGDSSQLLLDKKTMDPPDVVYVDPMFPPRTKSAAVKKNMQILHGLLDTQLSADLDVLERKSEESQLLSVALGLAKGRVVVKRPIKAVPLGSESADLPPPSYAVKGSTSRWDVYVK
jgi:16S rRNA (guanine1516-N2)-methyltransferase